MTYSWQELDDIAIDLYEKYPEVDPLKVRFTDLLDYILKLESFTGKREESNEAKLEAVQMAWYEEWKDNQ
jgi:FeS assembly protein IscX